MSYVSVDVDIDDIICGMNRWDRRQFFQAMQEDGYISKSCIITNEGEVKAPAHIERNNIDNESNEFNQALNKLHGNGWRMTLEQEQYIIELSKRF